MHEEIFRGEELAEQIRRGEVPISPLPVDPHAPTQIAMPAVRDDSPDTVRPVELKQRAGKPQQGRVIVADDDTDIRQTLAAELRGAGFAVREAENGLEALTMAVNSPPDPHVIVLDLWMPVLSGHAVRAALQVDRPDIQILIISASDYQNLLKQDPTYADEFVFTKPFDLDQLIRVVHERAREAQAMPKKRRR